MHGPGQAGQCFRMVQTQWHSLLCDDHRFAINLCSLDQIAAIALDFAKIVEEVSRVIAAFRQPLFDFDGLANVFFSLRQIALFGSKNTEAVETDCNIMAAGRGLLRYRKRPAIVLSRPLEV